MREGGVMEQQRQRAKRTAVVLALLAVGVYVAFVLKHFV